MEALGDLPLRIAYERLAGIVHMLGEDVQAIALHSAYAIDMLAPDTLTGAATALQASTGSVSTLSKVYERNMIDELALRLVHGSYR